MNTEQERAELLPCPFCGGSVSFHQNDEECREGCHYIECKTCGMFDLSTAADPANTVEDLGELRSRIAQLWNLRAALQSQLIDGWKEAFKAWQVCASIHREWAKGKDAMFSTRQGDFIKHAEDALKRSMNADALQSQPQTEASEWLKQHEALMNRVSKAAMVVGYDGTINGATAEQALENAEKALLVHARALQSQDREDAERYRALRAANVSKDHSFYRAARMYGKDNFVDPENPTEAEFDASIDHARRVEGELK